MAQFHLDHLVENDTAQPLSEVRLLSLRPSHLDTVPHRSYDNLHPTVVDCGFDSRHPVRHTHPGREKDLKALPWTQDTV